MLFVVDNTRSASKANDGKNTSTKTHVSRSLPIHPDLRKVLIGLVQRTDGRVFHGPCGGRLKPDIIRTVFISKVLKPLGKQFVSPTGEANLLQGRLHSFRHYFCSKCARDGVAIQTLMLWLGHSDSAMIRHYFHLHDDQAQSQMNKIRSVGSPSAV
jgi:integrase